MGSPFLCFSNRPEMAVSGRHAPLQVVLVLAFFSAHFLSAQTPFQVADLQTNFRPEQGASPLQGGFALLPDESAAVFDWSTDDYGRELWIVGSSSQPQLLLDIYPGPTSSGPSGFTAFDGWIYFSAHDLAHGSEVWRTQGAANTTELFADIWPGPASSSARGFVASDGLLYFTAASPNQGHELWRTDGLSAPVLISIASGPDSSSPTELTAGPSGGVYFRATTSAGAEPWFSGGTAATTEPLGDLYPGEIDSNPRDFIVVDATTLAFVARSPTLGEELVSWDEDTEVLTWHNIDEVDDSRSTSPRQLVQPLNAPGVIAFHADTEANGREPFLWTPVLAEPLMLKDIRSGAESSMNTSTFMVSGSDRIFFPADNGVDGVELYSSEGTAETTDIVADLEEDSGSSSPISPFYHDGLVYFSASTTEDGRELWQTDGSTTTLSAAVDGSDGLFPRVLGVIGTEIFLSAKHLSFVDLARTPKSQRSVDFLQSWLTASSTPFSITEGRQPGELYFSAFTTDEGREPWWIDSAEPLTPTMLEDLASDGDSSHPSNFTAIDTRVVFAATSSRDEPHVWDGATTQVVDLIVPEDSQPRSFLRFGSSVLMAARDAGGEYQLWKVDPEALSGEMLTSTGSLGPSNVFGYRAVVAGQQAFFAYGDDPSPFRIDLWGTDGTIAGTLKLTDTGTLPEGVTSSPAAVRDGDGTAEPLAVFASKSQLWASDGTVANTQLVVDLTETNPLPVSGLERFRRSGDRAFFVQRLQDQNFETVLDLYVTDGTPTGTTKLVALPSLPSSVIGTDNGIFFTANDSAHGEELWFSDGTTQGTRVIDLWPGPPSSFPRGGVAVGDQYYFFALTVERGRELWVSDGTVEGTLPLPETLPGPAGQGSIASLGASGNFLFFGANGMNGQGVELWAISLEPPLFADGFESGNTSKWN